MSDDEMSPSAPLLCERTPWHIAPMDMRVGSGRPGGGNRSIMAFVLKKTAQVGDPLGSSRILPPAPGAAASPQVPGQVPDRSDLWGHGQLPVPPVRGEVQRPRTERRTAQGILGVYKPRGGNDDDPKRFEQATVSYEEQRKEYPYLRTPLRPAPGYALADGIRIASPEIMALAAQATQELDPGE